MARNRKATPEVEKVRPYVEGVAKNLVDRLYGPEGPPWGTRMDELEDVVLAVRQLLAEQMLDQALQRQASTAEAKPEVHTCPGCERGTEPREPEPRLMESRAGEAEWLEPHRYCRKCRQAFFPSEPQPGHRSQ